MDNNSVDNEEDYVGPSTSVDFRSRRAVFEDDEVVKEMDVFVSQKLHNSLLCLLQFPLRPFDAKVHSNTKFTAQIKAKQRKLEIRQTVDITSKNYDRSRGEQLALNCASSKTNDSNPIFKKTMDYQMLVNDNVGGLHTNCYAVGVYRNNALHVNPVKEIMQMKPSFFYLDTGDEKLKPSDSGARDQDISSHDESDVEAATGPKIEAVRVKFASVGQESEAAKKRRVASYSYMQKMHEEEKWLPLIYKNTLGEESDLLRKQLLYADEQKSAPYPEFAHDSKELMRLFVPKAEEADVRMPQLPSDTISLAQLRSLPLPDQVQALMTNSKIMQFDQLISLLPTKADEQTVLKSLLNCAVLVQGCWVVKSEIIYPRHAISPKSGISGEMLCRARDFCLYKFSQSSSVDKKEISASVKIPAEDLQDILKQIGRLKYQRGWHFILATDADFINKHPDIVQRQTSFWEAKYQALCHQLNIRQHNKSGQDFKSPPPGRRRSASRSVSQSNADGSLGSLNGEEKLDRSACGQILEKSAETPLKNGRPNAIHPVVKVEPGQSNSSLIAEFKKFLYEKLSTKPCLTLSDIKRLLLLKLAESPPGSILSTGVSDMMIDRCATELGAVKIFAGKMTEPVFAYAELGSWPDARRVAVKLLSQKLRVTLKAFKDACSKSLEDVPGDNELRQILHDYCIQKSVSFLLVGT